MSAIENNKAAVVRIYQKAQTLMSDTNIQQIYLPNDFLGNGIILTSDGLICTTDHVIKNLKGNYYVVTDDNQIYQTQGLTQDPYSNLIFLKIETNNLSVVEFAQKEGLSVTDDVFVFRRVEGGGLSVSLGNIENLSYREISSVDDVIESTESLSVYIRLTHGLKPEYLSAPLFNNQGKVVGLGILDESTEEINKVIPSSAIATALNQYLKTGKITRTYFGINYIDLSKNINVPENLSQGYTNGILIYGDINRGFSAVLVNSPAEQAALKKGDIILKMENYDIDQNKNFTELVQSYQPEEVIELQIIQVGSPVTINLTLSEVALE